MKKNNIELYILFSFIAIILLWISIKPNLEHFTDPRYRIDDSFDLPGSNLPLGSKIHVKLNPSGGILYSSYKPPSAHGELGCTQVPCPSYIPDDHMCWCCCNYH